jgi:preprotein translocase subunit SecE
MAKSTETAKSAPAADGSKFDPVQFVRDSQAELSKVVWPGRQQLIAESLSVILMVSLSAITIYLVNNFFSWAASEIFK